MGQMPDCIAQDKIEAEAEAFEEGWEAGSKEAAMTIRQLLIRSVKQISTLNYILGRLEGLAEGLEENQQQYLLDTCEILDGLLREEMKE